MAQDGLQDLFTSLKMFNEGTQELAQATAVNRAAQRIKEIKAAMDADTGEQLSAAEQFSQIQQTGQDLATSLSMIGTPATTQQTLLGQLGALPAKTPEELIAQGTQAGGSSTAMGRLLLQRGTEGAMAAAAPRLAIEKQQADERAKERELDRQLKRELGQKEKLTPLSTKELESINVQENSLAASKKILEDVIKNPKFVGFSDRVPGVTSVRSYLDPEFGSFAAEVGQQFDLYRQKITGAGASNKELADLKKNTPVLSDSPATFKAKTQRFIATAEGIHSRTIRNLQRAHRDVSGFLDHSKDVATTPGLQKTTAPLNGTRQTIYKGADGKMYKQAR